MGQTKSFVEEYRNWLIWSAVLHVLVVVAFTFTNLSLPPRMPQQVAVKAELIDESKIKAKQEAKAREQRKRDEERRKAEQERKVKAEAEWRRKAEQERKAKAERERKAKAEQERKAKLKAEQERKAKAEAEQKAKAEADRKAKAEAERKAKAEAERKAREEAQRKAEEAAAAAKQAELMAAMEQEERLLAARNSGELAQYIALIRQRVERNWVQPAGAQAQIECEVNVSQIPGGEVVSVRVGRCNADPAVIRSIEAAVYKSSPLPLPENPALFERNLKFVFRPET